MYKVVLAACGNIDYNENPYDNIVNGSRVQPLIAECDNIKDCQMACAMYIEAHDLGGGNWIGGNVYDGNGEYVGRISYNCRYWDKDSEYGAEGKVRLR